jgi:ribosome maturation factor RimP
MKQTIEEIAEKHLPDDTHFVVDVQVQEKGSKSQVKILIDSDSGLKIDTCAKVSRLVAEEIEAKELFAEAYILEVSSPGVDFPLSSRRQYAKNIGRTLKIYLEDGKELEGELLSVGNADIQVLTKTQGEGQKADRKGNCR